MSRFLEFITTPSNGDQRRDLRFSLGNPVHDRQMPARYLALKGLRVDGSVVEFADETLPERVYEALALGANMQSSIDFDCVVFGALMNRDPIIKRPDSSLCYFEEKHLDIAIEADTSNAYLLDLAYQTDVSRDFCHVVVPAHTTEEAMYIHKLGRDGPLCLSGLAAAMKMYGCNDAVPIESFSPAEAGSWALTPVS